MDEQQSEDLLQRRVERLERALEAAGAGVWEWDVQKDCISWSDRVWALFGLESDAYELDFERYLSLVHPDDREHVRNVVTRALDSGEEYVLEHRVVDADGTIRWLEGRGRVYCDVAGKPLRMTGAVMDVTARKQVEMVLREKELRYRSLVEMSPDAIVRHRRGIITFANAAALRLVGAAHETDVLGRSVLDFTHPDDRERVRTRQARLAAGEAIPVEEIRIVGLDGRVVETEVAGATITEQGEPAVQLVLRDLTLRRRADRSLKESQQWLRLVSEQISAVLWTVDTDLRFTACIGRGLPLHDRKPEEVVGKSLNEVFGAHGADFGLIAAHRKALDGNPVSFEREWARSTYQLHIEPLQDHEGVVGAVAIAIDVTDRVQVREKLEELARELAVNLNQLETVIRSMNEGLIIADTDGMVMTINPAALRLFGFEGLDEAPWRIEEYAEQMVLYHLDGRPLSQEERPVRRALRGEAFSQFEIRARRGGSEDELILSCSGTPVYDEDGRVTLGVVTLQDVTERKFAEEALRLSEERYRSFVQHSTEGIFLLEFDEPIDTRLPVDEQVRAVHYSSYVAECNDAFARMYGYERRDEVVGIRAVDVHDDEYDPVRDGYLAAWIRSGYRISNAISEELDRNGNRIYISNNMVGIVEDGYLVRAWASQLDVTERVTAERRLRESEARYRTLTNDVMEKSKVGIFILDPSFRVVWINKAIEDFFDLDRDAVLGRDMRRTVRDHVVHAIADPSTFARDVLTTYDEDRFIEHLECRLRSKAGREERWLEYWSQPIRSGLYAGGRVEYYTDVTERKHAETELRREKQFIESLINSLPGIFCVFESDGRLIRWNRNLERVTGYDANELARVRLTEIITEEQRSVVGERIDEVLRAGYTSMEVDLVTRDGTRKPYFLTVRHLLSHGSKLLLGVGIDISERKKLEREILEIVDREQRRIGHDLHDGLGQLLTGIGFRIAELEEEHRRKSLPEAQDAAEIGMLVEEAIIQTRSLARGLNPVSAEVHGLVSALRELAVRAEQLFDVSCTFVCPHPVSVEDREAATHVYRIAQEAVNNAVKHGRASRILIRLTGRGDFARLEIRDDGVGLPPPSERGDGMGLRIMAYRAAMIAGTLDVEPAPEGGTVVICQFPVSRESKPD